jgi:N4-gp56 family major capsid protein
MAGPLNTSADIPAAVTSWYTRMLLVRAKPKLVHGRFGQRRPLPKGQSKTAVFRRYEALSVVTTPLQEGIAPSGQSLSYTDVSATIKQWGAYVMLTDVLQWTNMDNTLRETNRILAEQAAQSIDVLDRDEFVAGTTVYYGNNETSRSSLTGRSHMVDTTLLDRVIRGLENNNATKFTQMIRATTKISTFGIRPAYWCVTHPDVVFTLETLPGWVSVEEYASQGTVLEAEVGAYKNLRFLSTTHSKVWAGGGGTASGDVKKTGSNADVYTILVFAEDAVGHVPLSGASLQNIIKPPGSAGTADPLNQQATSGWKHTGTRVILNDNFLARVEITAGDVSP